MLRTLIRGRNVAGAWIAFSLAYACVGSDPDPVSPGSSSGQSPGTSSSGDGGSTVVDSGSDSTTPHAECHWDDPFEAPVLVAGDVNTDGAPEQGASLTADETRIFYITDPTNALDWQIYTATRKSKDDPFGGAGPVPSLHQASSREVDVSVDDDARVLVMVSDRSPAGAELYVSQADDAGAFGPPALPAELVAAGSERTPFLTSSRLLLFARPVPTTDNYDLFAAAPKSGAQFGFSAPTKFGSADLASLEAETSPVLSADGLTLYFARGAPNKPQKIWRAHRESLAEELQAPVAVGELNSGFDSGPNAEDAPSWISRDNCRIYITSTRRIVSGASARTDIYVAKREPKVR